MSLLGFRTSTGGNIALYKGGFWITTWSKGVVLIYFFEILHKHNLEYGERVCRISETYYKKFWSYRIRTVSGNQSLYKTTPFFQIC